MIASLKLAQQRELLTGLKLLTASWDPPDSATTRSQVPVDKQEKV